MLAFVLPLVGPLGLTGCEAVSGGPDGAELAVPDAPLPIDGWPAPQAHVGLVTDDAGGAQVELRLFGFEEPAHDQCPVDFPQLEVTFDGVPLQGTYPPEVDERPRPHTRYTCPTPDFGGSVVMRSGFPATADLVVRAESGGHYVMQLGQPLDPVRLGRSDVTTQAGERLRVPLVGPEGLRVGALLAIGEGATAEDCFRPAEAREVPCDWWPTEVVDGALELQVPDDVERGTSWDLDVFLEHQPELLRCDFVHCQATRVRVGAGRLRVHVE